MPLSSHQALVLQDVIRSSSTATPPSPLIITIPTTRGGRTSTSTTCTASPQVKETIANGQKAKRGRR
jgi:hypothetical protein